MKIATKFGVPLINGAFMGVEYEIEGTFLPSFVQGFYVHDEGSLRVIMDENGKAHKPMEYVSAFPKDLACTKLDLHNLNAALKEEGSDPLWSYRSSVHVHINVSDLSIVEWWNMVFLWMLYEESFIHYSGEERQGNLFCLSAREAYGTIIMLEDYLKGKDDYIFSTKNRYSACNFSSTSKFGSLEFRSMRGTTDADVLLPWFDSLMSLRVGALHFESPSQILEMALDNPDDLTKLVFTNDKIIKSLPNWENCLRQNAFSLALLEPHIDVNNLNFIDEPEGDV